MRREVTIGYHRIRHPFLTEAINRLAQALQTFGKISESAISGLDIADDRSGKMIIQESKTALNPDNQELVEILL